MYIGNEQLLPEQKKWKYVSDFLPLWELWLQIFLGVRGETSKIFIKFKRRVYCFLQGMFILPYFLLLQVNKFLTTLCVMQKIGVAVKKVGTPGKDNPLHAPAVIWPLLWHIWRRRSIGGVKATMILNVYVGLK